MASPLPIEISGTVDIEVAAWSHFALGVVYDGFGEGAHWWGAASDLEERDPDADLPPQLHNTPEDDLRGGERGGLDGMVDYLRARGGIYWAHNGGNFDFLAILESLRRRGISCQVDRSSQRVTRVVVGSLTLRDSYSVWPVPLDEIAGALRRPVPALPWTCACGKSCPGYCRIAEKAKEGDPDLLAYCRADCVTLYDGLHKLRDFATRHAINLRGTLAQTAWKAAQAELGLPKSDLPWHLWRSIRKADKGGRQCIMRPRAVGPGTHHDIASAYPAALAKTELPVGTIRELGTETAARGALGNRRPGVYTLTIRVPDLFVPPLPWSFAGRLYFPVGEITGTWCLPEVVVALERGCSIVKVHSAVIWETTAPIFGPLVERWYEIRRAVGRKTPLGQWIGRLAKAFTGKLAERPERERVTMHPETVKICLRTKHCRHGCSGRCGAYTQIDLNGEIWGIPYQSIGESAYPHWSAYLRAGTRIAWLEQAERYGTDLCFGNTDSLWTIGRRAPEPLGDGLGQWEYQHAWCDLDVRSASAYAFRQLPSVEAFEINRSGVAPEGRFVSLPGELQVRGIPWATEEDWKRGKGVIDRGVQTFQSAARGTKGLWARRIRRWTLPTSADDDRAIWGDRAMTGAGYTVPMHAEQIREMVRAQHDRMRKAAADADRSRKPRPRPRKAS